MTLQLRSLGQTRLEVSPIGLGVMQFAGGKGFMKAAYSMVPQEVMNTIVKAAWDNGINWFDTAQLYGGGHSEKGLAAALAANGIHNEQAVIATKWWPLFKTARNITRTITERQHYLSPYAIDLYQVHQPISFSSPEEEMKAMADLVESGKIQAVGVSNFSAIRMRRAHAALKERGLTLASNQVQYSLLHRDIETNDILESAKELGITIIAWGPLDSGLLSGKFHKKPETLKSRPIYRRRHLKQKLEVSRPLIELLDKIAAAYESTAAQVALNWLINFHGDTVVAIPGASRHHQVEQNAGAMNLKLTNKEMSQINELTRQFC